MLQKLNQIQMKFGETKHPTFFIITILEYTALLAPE